MATKLRLLAGRLKRATDPADWVNLASGRIKSVTTGTSSLDLLSGRRKVVVAVVPDLVSVGISSSGGDTCTGTGNWLVTYSWTTTSPNDTDYQIDVYTSTQSTPSTFNLFSSGNTTSSSSVQENTGIQVNVFGAGAAPAFWRTGRIKLVRKSDSVVIEEMDTTTEVLNQSSEFCV